MEEEEPQKKCDKYKYYNRCHIKNYIENHLLNAYIANKLNLKIDELNYIMEINANDPNKNASGEHPKYDEITTYFRNGLNSSIITNKVIDNFLDEII
jgi:hypothetical protein